MVVAEGMASAVGALLNPPTVLKSEFDKVVKDYEKLRQQFTEYQDEDKLTLKHRAEVKSLEEIINQERRMRLNAENATATANAKVARVEVLSDRLSRVIEALLDKEDRY